MERGIKCNKCNGTGIVRYIEDKEMSIEKAIKICDVFIKSVRSDIEEDAEDNFETIEAIETVLKELKDKNEEITRLGKMSNEYKKAINCKKCDCSICQAHINTLELRKEIEQLKTALNSSISKDTVKEIIDRNVSKNTHGIFNGYVFDFNGCQQIVKEIVKLLRESEDK